MLYGNGKPGGPLKNDVTPLWMTRLGSTAGSTSPTGSAARVALFPAVLHAQAAVQPVPPSPPSPPSPTGSGSLFSSMSDLTLSESEALGRRYVLVQDGYLDPVALNAQGPIVSVM
jgi:hypothetical protein